MSRSSSVVPAAARHQPIAHFDVYFRSSPETTPWKVIEVDPLVMQIAIFPHDEFYLGRGDICRGELEDPTVSNRHAKVHCLTFESDGGPPLPPLVYVADISSNGTYLTQASDGEDQRLDRKSAPRLMFVNDILRLGGDTFCFLRFEPSAVASPKLTNLQTLEAKLFEHEYEIHPQVVGVGGQGAVYVAVNSTSRRQMACKVLELGDNESNEPMTSSSNASNLSELDQSVDHSNGLSVSLRTLGGSDSHMRAYREIRLLKGLNHPNIVNIEKIFCSNSNVYIFQELVTGGDLFSFIEFKRNNLHDAEAALILLQILRGVEYLHSRNIVHRDLKPENILMTSFSAGSRIMLADFGSSRLIPQSAESHGANVKRMYSLVGTVEYSAPEIHKRNKALPPDQGYSKAVDTWAIGVIASILISGESIFVNLEDHKYHDNPRESILGMASVCDMSVLDTRLSWQNAGKRAKDFVKQLLVLDEVKRMTVTQALAHPWFTNRINADHFQELYQRAISDWQPRPRNTRMTERLDASKLRRPLVQSVSRDQTTLATSHHFPAQEDTAVGSFMSANTSIRDSQSICESVLPQILEEEEDVEGQFLLKDAPESMTNQRARNLIAKDIKDMDMSMSMKDLSLEQAPVTSDMDMDDVDDEGADLVVPVSTANSQSQLQQRPETSNANKEETESPDPITVALPTSQVRQKIVSGALKCYTTVPRVPGYRKGTHPRIGGPLRTCMPTKLSDMYVGDGFDGVLLHSDTNIRRIPRGRKRLRLN